MIFKNKYMYAGLFFSVLLSLIPFNFIIGSKFSWLSCATMIVPAISYQYSLLYVIFYIFTKILCAKAFSFIFLLKKLPLFFSTIALQQRNFWYYVILPIAAFALFVIHPVGIQVWYYGWLWTIPVLVYSCTQDNIWNRALSASCIAHAVGSVVWLYTTLISVEQWQALMLIVPIERFFIAIGIVVSINILDTLKLLGRKADTLC
ncbi:MAG: hypothetical protein ACXWL2_03860 [Candidatus Chromulinivorax sp.]